MKCWLVIAFVTIAPLIAFCSSVDTAVTPPLFYEREADDIIRLFYDDHYYLVDKHCEFRAIERVGRYDFQKQLFVGEFTDFDNHGNKILEGDYVDGRRHGEFKAYHPNGQLKWQVSYLKGIPDGLLKFFYPDGKPLLEVTYTDKGVRILNFWDRRGRQRVADGKGRYEFSVVADGYNEFGYTRYIRKGKVVDGAPHGSWTTEYFFADGKKKKAGYEYYQKGRFIQGYEAYTDEEFFDAPRYDLLPVDFSHRAEALIVKGCTIDEYTGFTGFLAAYLSDWFDGALGDVSEPVEIEFMVTVADNGAPREFEMKRTFNAKQYADLLLDALNGVTYWLPSYTAGGYIDDTLTVTMEAFPDTRSRKMQFYEVTIQREKGI